MIQKGITVSVKTSLTDSSILAEAAFILSRQTCTWDWLLPRDDWSSVSHYISHRGGPRNILVLSLFHEKSEAQFPTCLVLYPRSASLYDIFYWCCRLLYSPQLSGCVSDGWCNDKILLLLLLGHVVSLVAALICWLKVPTRVPGSGAGVMLPSWSIVLV